MDKEQLHKRIKELSKVRNEIIKTNEKEPNIEILKGLIAIHIKSL